MKDFTSTSIIMSDTSSPGPSTKKIEEAEESRAPQPAETHEAEEESPSNAASSSKSKLDSDEEQDGEGDEDTSNSESDDLKAPSETSQPTATASQWQAIWSPQYNAYYFFNPSTQETTWTNPLQPEASSSTASATEEGSSRVVGRVQTIEEAAEAAIAAAEASAQASSGAGPQMSAAASHYAALQAAALAQGIDPALAHLDPSLLQSSAIPGSTSGPGELPTFQAKFNARTGQFAPMSSRTPGHLSEYERAKRMSEFYFDVNKWEEDLAKRGGRLMGEEGEQEDDGTGKKRKRPSKKDLDRFKEQKKAKKIAKTAWLRT
ncbi:hypothetical protein D9619_010056 [Psilocybe cf. subviscida]|uniref:WW domain-containing protein n=1 Tax=Psilocybe cf. subviscida TaxID=2480587 RepID=A0A8H5BL60_9AGAR|nr:hypothetical protein D9619_010056 [Psilocybe cf. subviscida]